MLVLTRKTGQQIILPKHGITIEVMRVGRSQVRLGIAAPAEVSIDRRNGGKHGSENGCGPRDPAAGEVSHKKPRGPACSLTDFDRRLAAWIMDRTGGRVSELTVETCGDQTVVCGAARSHYARQLAEAAVEEFLAVCDGPSHRSVQFKIYIGQVYWRSNGHERGLAKLRGDGIDGSETS